MTSRERIAVLGAGGTMGFPMAQNLAQAGFGVRAWNRMAKGARQHGDADMCATYLTSSPSAART